MDDGRHKSHFHPLSTVLLAFPNNRALSLRKLTLGKCIAQMSGAPHATANAQITPIFQFGTSRFLQAHAALFIAEARAEGQDVGPITVVQTSGDPARSGRLAALAATEGYPVRIRGLHNGTVIDREQRVNSVRRTLSTATDWAELVALFAAQASYVISNTGDMGFTPCPADDGASFNQAMSYPAKLRLLLRARFDANRRPLTILPTELIARNGAVLKARVAMLAANDPPDFQRWLEGDLIWVNSLVDRIVSAPIEPAGAVAEPYALWGIEDQPGLVPPCWHPCIQVVGDLEPIEALKLFILNLGHTYLVSLWQSADAAPATVAEFLSLPAVRAELLSLYADEVLPGFTAAGLGDQASAYVSTTLERFQNPYLAHRLAEIAVNHREKILRRVAGFLAFARRKGDLSDKPRLTALVRRTAAGTCDS